jgi:uncharacterized spore protein YtfJ
MDEHQDSQAEQTQSEMDDSEAVIAFMEDTMDTFMAAASVNAVYAEPVKKGDILMIPAAEVIAGLGFGVGSGSGPITDKGSTGNGVGGGGGGRVFSRPVAVIVASPEGVRVEPVFDITKIALAAITASAVMIGMFRRLRNPMKTLEGLGKGEMD